MLWLLCMYTQYAVVGVYKITEIRYIVLNQSLVYVLCSFNLSSLHVFSLYPGCSLKKKKKTFLL